MWHTAAFSGSIAAGTAQAVAAIADGVFKIGSANGFVLQEDMMLLGAYAGGTNIDNPALKSPKLNQFNPLVVQPFNTQLANNNGQLHAWWPYRPFTFRNQEEVTAICDNTSATTAQTEAIVADFSNGVDAIPPGEELFVTFTSTTAAVANAWTLLTLTITQTLPEGVYVMIASEHESTTAYYHRWTFWGQFYRPGFPSSTARSNPQAEPVRWLTLGAMGKFSNVTLPNCEVLCSGTDNSHKIQARCIKVA